MRGSPDTSSGSGSRSEPLSPPSGIVRTPGLNERLDTSYIDVPDEDTSCLARMTRQITKCTGAICSPRRMLVVLRVLKAVTICFLLFTIVADIMYVFFVKIFASPDVRAMVGGPRDTIIRIYGLALTVLAVSIELDYVEVIQRFSGLKGFIPRSVLLFFIVVITSAHPLHADLGDGDNENLYDDDWAKFDEGDSEEFPNSTVAFQMITSLVLLLCAGCYFVLGLLCVDRFTTKAFLSTRDPVKSTAIPPPSYMTQEELGMGSPETEFTRV